MDYQPPHWILWLERRFHWISIPNLAIYLIVLQVIGFFFVGMRPDMQEMLILNPRAVWQGEYWRLITFFVVPVSRGFWMLFFFWFLYFVLKTLEQYWGEFQLTLYFLISWFGTILVSLFFNFPVYHFAYIQSTFFFALATLMPDYEILFFFLFPVKLKWLALFSAILTIGLPFVLGSMVEKIYLVLAGANYLLFFGPGFVRKLMSRQ